MPSLESNSELAMNAMPTWERVQCAETQRPPRDSRPTRVIVVRHGETDWNAAGIYQGSRDVSLNASGRSQALALRALLAELSIDAAYTSPLARAVLTAELVLDSGARGVVAHCIPALRELSYGDWEGVLPQRRRASWPALDAQWATDPWAVQFPGGESLESLADRALPVWERLLAEHAGQTILLSGHGHLNRVILLHARSLSRGHFWAIEQANGSATMLECVPTSPFTGIVG